jgi:hypothetical protein
MDKQRQSYSMASGVAMEASAILAGGFVMIAAGRASAIAWKHSIG